MADGLSAVKSHLDAKLAQQMSQIDKEFGLLEHKINTAVGATLAYHKDKIRKQLHYSNWKGWGKVLEEALKKGASDDLLDVFSDSSKVAKLLTSYQPDNSEKAMSKLIRDTTSTVTTMLDEHFLRSDDANWRHATLVLDESVHGYCRENIGEWVVRGVNECYDSVKDLMGKYCQIQNTSIMLDGQLRVNPNAIKFSRAMLTALPLTIPQKRVHISACSNQLDESKFLDICSVIKSFTGLEALNLKVSINDLINNNAKQLVLALLYHRGLKSVTLDFSK